MNKEIKEILEDLQAYIKYGNFKIECEDKVIEKFMNSAISIYNRELIRKLEELKEESNDNNRED